MNEPYVGPTNGAAPAVPSHPSPVSTAESRRQALGSDYCNDDYPVLSFLFALYCDADYSTEANARFISSGGRWDRYLDNYRMNRRRSFPPGAMDVIHREVPSNPEVPPGSGRYVPTEAQCAAFIANYLVPELTMIPATQVGEPPARLPRDLAFHNADRPVLANLALIFLNRDRDAEAEASLERRGIPAAARVVLGRVQWTPEGRPFLTEADVMALAPSLIADMTRAPSMW